ncbi:HET-domain-containing protein [Xylariaceae sp. FL1651]|nr:HET-domain-containing protein [Xylariaceae sp. FL1651]
MAAADPPIPAIKPSDPVCFYCSQTKDIVNLWTFQILDIARLQSGAELGCRTCDLRYRAVSYYNSDPNQRVIFQADPKRLTFDRRRFFEIFKLPNANPDTFPTIQTGHCLSSSTSSQETINRIGDWIKDCTANHETCRAGEPIQRYMPKRILNLRNDQIVLQEDAEPSTYACLSHCWGPSQSPIKTLSSTLNKFKRDIPWRSLSKTFQDAVDICRRLGINYLWIDSLCIIQDSDEDWAEESVKMADIYANAFLTIAATKSRDGSGGCYSERDPTYVNCGTVITDSVYIRGQMPRFGSQDGRKAVEDWPLLLRGWVYQEMSLSSRVVHFGNQEVVWQCCTHRRSESGSNDSDYAKLTFSKGHVPTGRKHEDAWDDGSPNDNPWYDIVSDYSGLALSFDKDKLPALAAISQRSVKERAMNDKFLAGLWQDTLLLDMLWETYPQSSSNGPMQKPTAGSPPSWSWASVTSRVKWFMLKNYMSPHYPVACTTLSAIHVDSLGSPYLGRYRRCELVFRGPLIATTSKALEVSIFMKDTGEENAGYRIDGTMAVHQFTPDYLFDIDGPVYGSATSSKFILPLMIQHGGVHLVVGIVLRPMAGSSGVYERIGLVTLIYVKQGPPKYFHPQSRPKWDYHPWRPITRQWINDYLSSLPMCEITIR